MEVTGAWSRPELTEFLDAERVPVRLACHTPSGHLWMLSLWYLWTDGDVASERLHSWDFSERMADVSLASDDARAADDEATASDES
ncbi:hypothetical protein [Halobellus salinisoli]|uniref:hypothetical protein n=1 Tax=Halobellus salinisoli TaxID=3108500 RepID=UPI00300AE8DA